MTNQVETRNVIKRSIRKRQGSELRDVRGIVTILTRLMRNSADKSTPVSVTPLPLEQRQHSFAATQLQQRRSAPDVVVNPHRTRELELEPRDRIEIARVEHAAGEEPIAIKLREILCDARLFEQIADLEDMLIFNAERILP